MASNPQQGDTPTKQPPNSKKTETIQEIEHKVDQLIQQNKHLYHNTKHSFSNNKKTPNSLNTATFSPIQKHSQQIYYLKKKNKKDHKDDSPFSEEIISTAREKLGEEPFIPQQGDQKPRSTSPTTTENKKPPKAKTKWHVSFGKTHKKTLSKEKKLTEPPKPQQAPPPSADEISTDGTEKNKTDKPRKKLFTRKKEPTDVEQKEALSDQNTEPLDIKTLQEKYPDHINIEETHAELQDEITSDESDMLDQRIQSSADHTQDKKTDEKIAEKAHKLAEHHDTFGKKDASVEEIEKEKINQFLNQSFETQASPVAEPDEKESVLIDKQIKQISKEKEENIDEEEIVAEKATELAEKHKTSSKQKPEKSDEHLQEQEHAVTQPMFHVEDIPESDDITKEEEDLLNEKIRGVPVVKEKTDEKTENLLDDIAKKPSGKPALHEKEKLFVEDTENKESFKAASLTPGEEEGVEHVFFDETETAFDDKNEVEFGTPEIPVDQDINPEIDISKIQEGGEIELPKESLQVKNISLEELGFSKNHWEELDFYSLEDPFSYVEVLREKDSFDKRYFLVEINLTDDEKQMLHFIKGSLNALSIEPFELEEKGEEKYLENLVTQVIQEYNINISDESRKKVVYFLEKDALGLGKLEPLMKDPNIEDISCDGADSPLFLYHRKYGSLKSNVSFKDEDDLSSFVVKLAQKCGKHISVAEPILDATMPDGSRIQMTLSTEVTTKGSTFTIRKFREDPFSPPDIVEFNTMSSEMVAYMWMAVENGVNALIAGGTASGKTSTLNALSLFIPRESKIVSIEETREINLPHPNWIPGVARSGFGEVVGDKIMGEIDMFDLMKAALRQRPEYILVGEIRGREAYVLFQAMATGHTTYSTAHADSAQSLIHRLEGKPINIPRIMLQALDIVCIQVTSRVQNKRARRCKQIIEIIDIDPVTKEILTNEVFRWDPVEDSFIYSGKSYVMERIRAEKDLSREAMTSELKNRSEILQWLNTKNIRDFRRVATVISQYLEKPDDIMKTVRKES